MEKIRRYVRDFGESTLAHINLVGGKGAYLSEMTRLGLPVPPGFTITTRAAKVIKKQGYKSIREEVRNAIKRIERKTDKQFGNLENPLLVSVRSGATVSMPGIMETILNVGLNSEIVEKQKSDLYTKCFYKLILNFGHHIFNIRSFSPTSVDYSYWISREPLDGITRALNFINDRGFEFPQSPNKQLELAIKMVFDSWNSEKANKFRALENILDNQCTAVNIQKMVFGNLDDQSLTAAYFTRNPSTGEKTLFGSFIPQEQGDALVGGDKSKPLSEMPGKMLEDLKGFGNILEDRFKDMQEIEVTIESGKPYVLQTRNGKRTERAGLKILLEKLEAGRITEREVLMKIKPDNFLSLRKRTIDPQEKYSVASKGTGVVPGIVSGSLAYNLEDIHLLKNESKSPILVAYKLAPEQIQLIYESDGIFTAKSEGNSVSHAIVVARSKNKSCVTGVVGLGFNSNEGYWHINGSKLRRFSDVTINGESGEIILQKVNLLESKVDEELNTILKIAEKYTKKNLVLISHPDKVSTIPSGQGVFYMTSYPLENEDNFRSALQGDGKSLKRLKRDFFEEYSHVVNNLKNNFPVVLGLIKRQTLEEFVGNRDRYMFRKLFLDETLLLEREYKLENKDNPTELVTGMTFIYSGQSVRYQGIGSCGCPRITYPNGHSKCISASELPKFSGTQKFNFQIGNDELKRTSRGFELINSSRILDLQKEVINSVITKSGSLKVYARPYSPMQSSIQLGPNEYRIFSQDTLAFDRLISAQEAIKSGC